MVDFVNLMLEKGTCCICTKPLKDSKYLNLAHLDKKAAWKYPVWTVWNNILTPGMEDRAVAVVCDGCQEAAEKSGVGGSIKYAVEIRGDDVIMHDIEELEDAVPVQEIIASGEKKPDIPDFFTGSVDDRKKLDDLSFASCLGSKKDQRHGFYGGLN